MLQEIFERINPKDNELDVIFLNGVENTFKD